MFNIAEQARRQGIEVRPQMAGRPTGVLHGLQSNFHVFMRHPTYATELKHLPLDANSSPSMQDPAVKAKILAEHSTLQRTISASSLDELLWQIFPLGEKPNYEPDRADSVAGIAQRAGRDAFEVMYDLLVDHDGKELFYQPLGGYRTYNFDFFRKNMQHPNIMFGLSDGGAHCGVIADAGMPTFILTHWARDRTKGEQLPLEYLVRKLSFDTATAYGMHDRGSARRGPARRRQHHRFREVDVCTAPKRSSICRPAASGWCSASTATGTSSRAACRSSPTGHTPARCRANSCAD